MFGKWKKNFCLRILCVCLRILVPEFLSKRILCLEKNFCLITGILCVEKRIFGFSVCNQNFLFGKRIFVPEFCVCVCLRIFVSEFLVFWKKNFFCNRNFKKESFFACQK